MDKGFIMDKEKMRKLIPDFARKIAPIYKMLDWRWKTLEKGKTLVPDVLDIVETLNMLLDDLDEATSRSTGGLSMSHNKTDGTFIMDFTVKELVCLDE